MEHEIIPFQTSQGMVVVGSWVGEQEDDLYVWIRRFDSESDRERLYKSVYESAHWKDKIDPKIPEMIDRQKIVVTRLEPTPQSAMR